MNLRKALRKMVPPLVETIYHNMKNGLPGFYIWKGVYKDFRSVPVSGNSYFDQEMAKETASYTGNLLNGFRNQNRIPYYLNEENILLPMVSAFIMKKEKSLSVLDLGGGMGIGYISLLGCIENLAQLRYLVIETPGMCAGGRQLFRDDKRIQFMSDFPDELPPIDIVFVNSALQYFENYFEVLTKLSGYNPEYFLFVKFSAGNVPTFVSAQRNLQGTNSAYWFLNIKEIIEKMTSLGYSLEYKSALSRIYDQDNFPKTYRLGQMCNLLFARSQGS